MNEEIWVFLSHSNEDYDKVKLVRDLLEQESFRPIMFFLKCLHDHDEIDGLIKREIDARKRFVLCDSDNARKSAWVQHEVEYIKSKNRMYETINLDASTEEIAAAIKRFRIRTTVFLEVSSYKKYDIAIRKRLKEEEFRYYDYKSEMKTLPEELTQIKSELIKEIEEEFTRFGERKRIERFIFEENSGVQYASIIPFSLAANLRNLSNLNDRIMEQYQTRIDYYKERWSTAKAAYERNILEKKQESLEDAQQNGFYIVLLGALDRHPRSFKKIQSAFSSGERTIIVKLDNFMAKTAPKELKELVSQKSFLDATGKNPVEVAELIMDHLKLMDDKLMNAGK